MHSLRVLPQRQSMRTAPAPLTPPSFRLSPRRRLALGSIAQAIFFGPHGPVADARLAWLLEESEDFLSRAGVRARLLIGTCLLAVCVLAPLSVRRFSRLSRLELPERVHALRTLEASALAAPLFALKAFLSLLYYEHPEAQREIGFDARCLTDAVERS